MNRNAQAEGNIARMAPPPSAAALSSLETFLGIVDRLEATVDAESEALSRNLPIRIADINNSKRQGMLELNRIMRVLSGSGLADQIRERLGPFIAKLDRNRFILDVHLRAVRDVADVISRTMQDAESDGTYSMLTGRL